MSTAPSQLDIFEALARREAGQDLVIGHCQNTDYKERLTAAIKVLAAGGARWCSDDVRALAGDPPPGFSPNLVGAVLQRELRAGSIRLVDWTRSARVVGHGNRVGVFRGVQQ